MLEPLDAASAQRWGKDLDQIKALGFNTVRCWIDWASGEPAEGAYRFETIDVLFKSQVEWLTAEQPEGELIKVMERAGLPARDCVSDGRLFDKVVGDVQSGQALGVKFTPTLFINEQKYGNPEGGVLGIDAILRQVGR